MGQDPDACATRGGRLAGGEDGDDGADHLAFQRLDHGEDRERIFDVAVDSADAVHRVVDAVAGDGLEHVHHLLAQLEAGHEHGLEAHELGRDARPEHMGVQAFQLRDDHANVPGARGRRQAGQPLHRLAKCKRVDVGADAADALHQRDHLDIVAALGQMLDAAKVKSDVQLGVGDCLARADQVQLVGLFQRRVVGSHGNLVAHSSSSRRFTPGLSPWRRRSGSYSRPRKSTAKPS